jgi:ABC-type branched-subunit amino acid transport system ATPase component
VSIWWGTHQLSGYVLESGHIVLEGPREILLNDRRVQQSFMGI